MQIDRGLLECDFGEWTGEELKRLMKLPEWSTVQRGAGDFRFPGGESFTEMQTRIVGAIDTIRRCPRRRRRRVPCRTPIRSRRRWRTRWARISTCSSDRRVAVLGQRDRHTAGGPAVLTVNSTGGSLADLRIS